MNTLFRTLCRSVLLPLALVGSALGADCVAIPSGVVGWWMAEDSALDFYGQSTGTLAGGVTYVPGKVGQAFSFNGIDSAVVLGKSQVLQLQNFTFETWIKRTSAERLSQVAPYVAAIMGGGANHFALALYPDGRMTLGKVGESNADSSRAVTGTEWHHVAAIKNNTRVEFYINGQPAGVAIQTSTFSFETPLAIGSLGESYPGVGKQPFWGLIDEPSFYDRALSAEEVLAIYRRGAEGKCDLESNMLSNGSFEQPAYSSVSGFVRTRNLPGWAVASGAGALDVELANFGGMVAADGVQCLDLEGAESEPEYFIRQGVSVQVGHFYRLEFAYAKHPSKPLSRMRVELTGASTKGEEFEHSTINSRTDPGWVRSSLEFVATFRTVQIRFSGISPDSGFGMMLDDVSLAELPRKALRLKNPGFEQLSGTNPTHFDTQGNLLPGHFTQFPASPVSSKGFNSAEPIPGWEGTNSAGIIHHEGQLAFPGGIPEGRNALWINNPGTISQTLTNLFEPDRLYRLSASIGTPTGLSFPGYDIGLYADGQAVVRGENSVTISTGKFSEVSLVVQLHADSPHLGKPIQIRLGTPGSTPGQVNFDKVSLEVESVEAPEGCVPKIPSLVAWYRGEGSGEDWLRTFPANFEKPLYGTGQVGQAFEFNGSNEVVIPAQGIFNRTAFTLDAWIFPTALDGMVDIILSKEASPDSGGLQFSLGIKGPINEFAGKIPVGNLAFRLGGVTGLPDDYAGWTDALAGVPLSKWTHVALAVEVGAVSVFVNGRERRRLTGLDAVVRPTSGPLKIGSRHDSIVSLMPGERFNGRIDEVGFHNRKLNVGNIVDIVRSGRSGRCSEYLELQLTGPSKVPVNEDFVVTARVINQGLGEATVTLTNVIPVGVSVQAITNSQGRAMNLAGVVISDFGILPGRQEATVHFVCRALLAGSYQIIAALEPAHSDSIEANNHRHLDFEAAPLTLSLGDDQSVTENAGFARIPVLLSAPVARELEVSFSFMDGTANGGDYRKINGIVRLSPGETEATIDAPIIDDPLFEKAQTFTVMLHNPANVALKRTNATVTILNDDPLPRLVVDDQIIREGNTGTTTVVIPIQLSGANEESVTVDYATARGTALSPTDFVESVGTLTFSPMETRKTVEVRVNGDTVVEPNESFLLNLTNPVNAELPDSRAIVAIVNDDHVPNQLVGFVWDPGIGTPGIGEAFPTRLTAVDGGGLPVANFNGVVQLSAFPIQLQPLSVQISEVFTGVANQCSVEFSNVTTNRIDLSDWKVTFYDSTTWPLPRGTVSIPSGATLEPAGVFRISEGAAASTYPSLQSGFQIAWANRGQVENQHIALIVQDANGRIADFFCAMRAYPEQIAVPVSIPVQHWTGLPLIDSGANLLSYQRIGTRDNNSARDWVITTASLGQLNAQLSVPFANAIPLPVAPGVALNFQGGVWTGSLELKSFSTQVSLLADDGNGNFGYSSVFPMSPPNDLAVSLEVTPSGSTVLARNIHYRAIAKSQGDLVSSNVVVELRLPSYYGTNLLAISGLAMSQGISEWSLHFQDGLADQPGLMLRAQLGELSTNGMATIEFDVSRTSPLDLPKASFMLMATAIATRAQPELNFANNTADAFLELNTGCLTLPEGSVSWWRGENDASDSLGGSTLEIQGNNGLALTYGPGRILETTSAFRIRQEVRVQATQLPGLELGTRRDFTIEGWMRMLDNVRRDRITLFDKRDRISNKGFVLFVDQGRLACTLIDGNGVAQSAFSPAPTANRPDLRDGRWHHVALAVSRSSGVQSILLTVDGDAISPPTGSMTGDMNSAAPLRFGYEAEDRIETAFDGLLDEVTLYSTALSAATLRSIASAGGAGKCLSELAVEFVNPIPTNSVFPASISYGKPLKITVALTNIGPLALNSSWLSASLSQLGLTRFLTPPKATNSSNPFRFYYDFGKLPPHSSSNVEIEIVLTNVPNSLFADFLTSTKATETSERISTTLNRFYINPDGDADGAEDRWELANRLDPLDSQDATADTDGDGMNNVNEYHLGTNPRDPTDTLKLEFAVDQAGRIRIQFPGKAGKNYQLLRRTETTGGEWTEVNRYSPTESVTIEFTDVSPLLDAAFYKVRLGTTP